MNPLKNIFSYSFCITKQFYLITKSFSIIYIIFVYIFNSFNMNIFIQK